MALPSPAPISTSTERPARTSASTPAGTIATRYSSALISRGIPIFIADPFRLEEAVHPEADLLLARRLAQDFLHHLPGVVLVRAGRGGVRGHDLDHEED